MQYKLVSRLLNQQGGTEAGCRTERRSFHADLYALRQSGLGLHRRLDIASTGEGILGQGKRLWRRGGAFAECTEEPKESDRASQIGGNRIIILPLEFSCQDGTWCRAKTQIKSLILAPRGSRKFCYGRDAMMTGSPVRSRGQGLGFATDCGTWTPRPLLYGDFGCAHGVSAIGLRIAHTTLMAPPLPFEMRRNCN